MRLTKILTELHADVFIGVFLPQLLILVFVTHEREDDFLANGLQDTEPTYGQEVKQCSLMKICCTFSSLHVMALSMNEERRGLLLQERWKH